MLRYNQPHTLFNRAKETICNEIVNECKAIEDQFDGIKPGRAYDNANCAALVHTLHDKLLSIIPPTLCNDICASALACHDKRNVQIKDIRILYGVLVNENLTIFQLGQAGASGIECVLPDLKNIVKLDLISASSSFNEIIIALSFICVNLEHIAINFHSSEPFRALINRCLKLRVIKSKLSWLKGEDIGLALTQLENLEVVKFVNTAEAITSLKIQGPLKLTSLDEFQATPYNVKTAINKCPQLTKLRLQPKNIYVIGFRLLADQISNVQHSNEIDWLNNQIFNILASNSGLKVTKLVLHEFILSDKSVERFFLEKGEFIQVLKLKACKVNDAFNFIMFIGSCCKNLKTLKITDMYADRTRYSYTYNIPSDWIPSFPSLEEWYFTEIEASLRKVHVKIFTALTAHSPLLQKVTICMYHRWGRYPHYHDIQQIFPIDRLKTLQHLELRHLHLTQRTAEYILSNAENLTVFVAPDGGYDYHGGSSTAARAYIAKMQVELHENNRKFEYSFWTT